MFNNVSVLPADYKLQEDEIDVSDDEFVAYWWAERSLLPIGVWPNKQSATYTQLRWVYDNRELMKHYMRRWSQVKDEFSPFSRAMRQVITFKKEVLARLPETRGGQARL